MLIDKEELEERIAILTIDNDVELTEEQALERAIRELKERKKYERNIDTSKN